MAFDAGLLSGIGSIIGGIGGLFGRKKPPSPRDNIMSQAQGARDAAEKYGFNPLTLLQYGQPGGSMASGSAPPLASIELITGGLRDVADVTSGDAERRRVNDRLQNDLAQLKLDQLRSGVVAVGPSAVSTVGNGPPPVGQRAASAVNGPLSQRGSLDGQTHSILHGFSGAGAGSDPSRAARGLPLSYPTDSRREADHRDQESHSGFMVMDNPNIPFPVYSLTMDGDEPVQWYDVPTFGFNVATSAAYDLIQKTRKRALVRERMQITPSHAIPRDTVSARQGDHIKPVKPKSVKGKALPSFPYAPNFGSIFR
ncbi:hypothetical protein [Szabonella alba]|uniref:Uncharacterized protein n=1 Tax=Szabonella alba TaxID=2804194 RepID=A0A8K0Y0W0_9RHOB|nr:hypothetical protein [Szabonella alba]MBL4917252.1 hypothetical protein [Szabonella alba]